MWRVTLTDVEIPNKAMGVNKNEQEKSESEKDEANVRMKNSTALQNVDRLLQYLGGIRQQCIAHRKTDVEKNKI